MAYNYNGPKKRMRKDGKEHHEVKGEILDENNNNKIVIGFDCEFLDSDRIEFYSCLVWCIF